MKKINFIIVLLVLIAWAGGLAAAGGKNYLRVVSANSKVTVKNYSGTDGVTAGDKLITGDIILVPEKGYIALSCSNGKPFEIREAGEYNAATLINNCDKITSGAFKNFSDWVVSNMIKQKSDKGSMMKNLGAVSRMSSGKKKVEMPVKKSHAMPSGFTLAWYPSFVQLGSPNGIDEGEKTIYKVSIELKGKEVFSAETSDTTCTPACDFTSYAGKTLRWHVAVKGYPRTVSDSGELVIISAEEEKEVRRHTEEVRQEFESPDSPLFNAVIADYYEGCSLMLDAYACHARAAGIPDPPEEFISGFASFCMRAR